MEIIFLDPSDLSISTVKTPGTETSIWELYVKHGGYIQISCDWFVYLGVFMSPQICPSYFKGARFSLILNPFRMSAWRCFNKIIVDHLTQNHQLTYENKEKCLFPCVSLLRVLVYRSILDILSWVNQFKYSMVRAKFSNNFKSRINRKF